MDDFYLLSNDKEYLKECLIKTKEYLANLKLTLNKAFKKVRKVSSTRKNETRKVQSDLLFLAESRISR